MLTIGVNLVRVDNDIQDPLTCKHKAVCQKKRYWESQATAACL